MIGLAIAYLVLAAALALGADLALGAGFSARDCAVAGDAALVLVGLAIGSLALGTARTAVRRYSTRQSMGLKR